MQKMRAQSKERSEIGCNEPNGCNEPSIVR